MLYIQAWHEHGDADGEEVLEQRNVMILRIHVRRALYRSVDQFLKVLRELLWLMCDIRRLTECDFSFTFYLNIIWLTFQSLQTGRV